MRGNTLLRLAALAVAAGLAGQAAAGSTPSRGEKAQGLQNALERLNDRARAHGLVNKAPADGRPVADVAQNFEVLGHNDLGAQDTNGDVWVHGDTAYVGTWAEPCSGRGVKVIDVSDLRRPRVIGAVASRPGTSAEDVVVRHVSTPSFTGDLLAAGMQRCSGVGGRNPTYGTELWDVTDPHHPRMLSELGLTHGGGGVHELDLVQRPDGKVLALLALPDAEWFDPVPFGDFAIVDVTNPRSPTVLSTWGAGMEGLSRGPFWGIGSFAATFDHSARSSADGMKAYLSWWDLGVLTLDISDPARPRLVGRTNYPEGSDGDAHSVVPYGRFLLQNDEDFDPRSPARVSWPGGSALAAEAGTASLWPEGPVSGAVLRAAGEGCQASDYASAAGKIVVATTRFPYFDGPPPWVETPCGFGEQELLAAAAGAKALVHDFIATNSSAAVQDFADAGIPVVYVDHAAAAAIVAAGSATLTGTEPTWGFLRVFDAATGVQVAQFDGVPYIHDLAAPFGFYSIHNTEVRGSCAYSAWYTNGIVALDLSPLGAATPGAPTLTGRFVPPAGHSPVPFLDGNPAVWGVAVRGDGVIFASDMATGLWIVRPTGTAANCGS